MAQISYNAVKKHQSYGSPDTLESRIDVVSIRDSLLNKIISNHLRGNVDVSTCLKNKDKFVGVSKIEDFSSSCRGLKSFDSYKSLINEAELREFLCSCGLKPDEIHILLEESRFKDKESDEAYAQKLKIIEEKLQKRQNFLEESSSDECFSGAVPLNRHDYEEEISMVSSNTAGRLSRCLIALRPYSDPSIHKDHPINHLQSLEKELFSKSAEKSSQESKEKSLPKKRKCSSTSPEQTSKFFLIKPSSFWDMKEKPIVAASQSLPSSNDAHVHYGSSENKMSSANASRDFSKPFVWAMEESRLIPLEKLQRGRLSVEELKVDPKFANYDPGEPSFTLYIKNLPRVIEPFVLVSVFGRFESENKAHLEYRLLKGRMKGQAFVKFKLLHVAVKAFDVCNGCIIESKPMVIEFSKKPC